MAETIKKLEEQLKCSVCLDIYTDPKLLQCFHIYCSKCLVKLVVPEQFSIPCPTCRQVTPVPANGVTGLQSAFQTNEILRIRDDLIKSRNTEASSEAKASTPTPTKITIPNCFEHKGKERELYCETCEDLICLKCAIKGGKHEGHDYYELGSAYERYKGEVRPSLEPMEGKLNTVEKALAQLDTRRREVSDQQAAIESNIHDTIREFHEFLDVRKTELIGKLHKITQSKLKCLTTQRDEMETIQAQLSSCLDFIQKTFETDSQGEVLMMKMNTLKQIEDLVTPFEPDALEPNTEADITFVALPDLNAACRNYGEVYPEREPDPSWCQATGKGLMEAVVGKKSTAVVQAINYKGEDCQKPIKSFECDLISEITGDIVKANIERKGQNQYEINYVPAIKGRHQLHIKVEDQHIRGSPFTIAVKLPVKKISYPILTIDEVKGPWGVAVNQRGEVFVTERDEHCVSVFSPCGKKLRSFGTYGSSEGQFNGPRGVAIDDEGNILVVDKYNHRIQKFTMAGEFIRTVGTKGNGPLQFTYPQGVSFNATNNKVYVVDSNVRVQVLNSDLTFSNTFGKEGSGKGHFKYPWGIACSNTGKVFVADNVNNHIQVFEADAKFERMFSRLVEGKEELSCPTGISIDANDRVYVSEYYSNQVSVFTSEGRFVTSFGRSGIGPGEFNCPIGLAVGNSGVVYVCDRDNNRIQCF